MFLFCCWRIKKDSCINLAAEWIASCPVNFNLCHLYIKGWSIREASCLDHQLGLKLYPDLSDTHTYEISLWKYGWFPVPLTLKPKMECYYHIWTVAACHHFPVLMLWISWMKYYTNKLLYCNTPILLLIGSPTYNK